MKTEKEITNVDKELNEVNDKLEKYTQSGAYMMTEEFENFVNQKIELQKKKVKIDERTKNMKEKAFEANLNPTEENQINRMDGYQLKEKDEEIKEKQDKIKESSRKIEEPIETKNKNENDKKIEEEKVEVKTEKDQVKQPLFYRTDIQYIKILIIFSSYKISFFINK